jgi:hypothetical protein
MSRVQLLELDVTADPAALLRVVSLCHKRGMTIASLRYESAGGRHPEAALASGRLRLALRGDAEAASRAARWLDAIVPALAVRSVGAQGAAEEVGRLAPEVPVVHPVVVVDLLGQHDELV